MQPEEVHSSAQPRAIVEERGLAHVQIGVFDNDGVPRFAASREWEEREFRRAVTDWELARYFEII